MAGSRDAAEELISRGIKLRQLALLVAVERSGQLSRAAEQQTRFSGQQ